MAGIRDQGAGIQIANLRRERDDLHSAGSFSVSGDDFAGVFRHEFGHALEYAFTELVKNKNLYPSQTPVSTIFGKVTEGINPALKSMVSRYACTNKSEMFAECFAAWAHPNYGKVYRSPKVPQELEQLFEKVFK